MLRHIRTTAALATFAALISSGCMTVDTRTGGGAYKGPPTYSGTRVSLNGIASSFYAFDLNGLAFFGIDLPASLIADTLLLPITIPEQLSYSEQVAEARQVEHDVPSVIDPPEGESTLKTGERFWDKCVSLTSEARNLLPNCYAVDARVVMPDGAGGTREFKGSEYKAHLRELMPQLRNTTRTVTFIEPKFEVEGSNVRIKAMRADSSQRERTPMTFLVGPGADGEWRILEQVGEGLPEGMAETK